MAKGSKSFAVKTNGVELSRAAEISSPGSKGKMRQPEAAYSNPPTPKSKNVTTSATLNKMKLAQTIYELYSMGLIREVVDEKGVPRFTPTEKGS